jgi:hypothetical protein
MGDVVDVGDVCVWWGGREETKTEVEKRLFEKGEVESVNYKER